MARNLPITDDNTFDALHVVRGHAWVASHTKTCCLGQRIVIENGLAKNKNKEIEFHTLLLLHYSDIRTKLKRK